MAESQVELVVEKMLVIGSAVEDDGKGPAWMDTCAEGCEDQLGDGDEHTANALIAYSQYLLAVFEPF